MACLSNLNSVGTGNDFEAEVISLKVFDKIIKSLVFGPVTRTALFASSTCNVSHCGPVVWPANQI